MLYAGRGMLLMTQRVLVLCTGNSCRSVMAEALFNHLGAGEIEAVSAGSFPAGYVHPKSMGLIRAIRAANHGMSLQDSPLIWW